MCDAPQSDEGIRKSLGELPNGLVETYSRIMEKIEKKRPKFFPIAEKALKWVICARRPLFMDELKEAIAFEPTDQYWQEGKIITDPSGQSILKACGHLITLDDEDYTVRLIHRTVQKFLMDEPDSPEHRFQFQREKAEFYLGEVCVTYLSFSDFETQMTKRNPDEAFAHKDFLTNGVSQLSQSTGIGAKAVDLSCRLRGTNTHRKSPDIAYTDLLRSMQRLSAKAEISSKYKLLDYAIENWVWHTVPFTKENSGLLSLWPRFERLATNHPLDFRRWGAKSSRRDLPYLPLLSWSIKEGHCSLLELLLDRGADIRTESSWNGTDLHLAAKHGHEAVVRLLLDKGAKVEAKNKVDQTALHLAATEGHEAVAQLLLNMNAAVEEKDEMGWTALHCAAHGGYVAIARHFIDWGANIEATEKQGRTALHYAAQRGHEAVVKLLLDRGANIEAKCKFTDSTALHDAALYGHVAVTELLLDKGADTEARSVDGKTAMDIAIVGGHEEVEKMLRLSYSPNTPFPLASRKFTSTRLPPSPRPPTPIPRNKALGN